MGKSMFTIKGNICSERVRLGRALQKPPITQEELAQRLQFMGMEDRRRSLSPGLKRTSAMSVTENFGCWQKH